LIESISTTENDFVYTTDLPSEYTVRVVDFENVDTNGTSRHVYLSAVVNDKSVLCMCDSVSDVNLMPYSLVDQKSIRYTNALLLLPLLKFWVTVE